MKKTKREQNEKLLSRNEKAISDRNQGIQTAMPLVQKIVDEAKKFDFDFTKGDLANCLPSPEEWATNEIKKQIPDEFVGKFKRKTDVYLPSFGSFIRAVDEFKKNNKYGIDGYLIKDGVVSIDEEATEDYIDKHSIYISDPDDIKFWERYSELTNAITKFNRMLKADFNGRMGLAKHNTLTEWIDHIPNQPETDVAPSIFTFNELCKLKKSLTSRKKKTETAE